MSKYQKYIVLFALFIVPLLFYIFLQLGTHNFGRLPIVRKNVLDVDLINKKYQFHDKVSTVLFLGDDLDISNIEVFNFNEKIYKKFYGYTGFQVIAFVVDGQQVAIEKIKKRLSINTNLIKWHFVFTSPQEMTAIYDSFNVAEKLDAHYHSSKTYIIDKENHIRRGTSTLKAQEKMKLVGYNMKSISELKDDMHDDLKILLAEYSFALKKNNNSDERRKQSISNEKK